MDARKIEISAPADFPAGDAQQCFELGWAAMVAANSAGLCVINGKATPAGAQIEMRTFRGNYAAAMNRFVDAVGMIAARDEAARLQAMGKIGGEILRDFGKDSPCGCDHCNGGCKHGNAEAEKNDQKQGDEPLPGVEA